MQPISVQRAHRSAVEILTFVILIVCSSLPVAAAQQNHVQPTATYAITNTITITSFDQGQMHASVTTAFTAGVPTPLTWSSYAFLSNVTVTNFAFTKTGTGNCVLNGNATIHCDGQLDTLVLTSQEVIAPTLTPPYVTLQNELEEISFGFSFNLTEQVTYPAPLILVDVTPPPSSTDIVHRQLMWTVNGTTQFIPTVRFLDPRYAIVFLPLIQR